jgi:signal transduction histidine kinase/CHASE3 domain sensor protein
VVALPENGSAAGPSVDRTPFRGVVSHGRRRRSRLVRIVTVFAPAAIVIVTGVLSYGAMQRGLASRQSVVHTRDVLEASTRLLTALLDAETSLRGFLLTHDSSILEPYQGSAARADSVLTRLRVLTADNPLQLARIDTLADLTHRRFVFVDSVLSASKQPGFVLSVGPPGPGRQMMRDIRSLIDNVEADEERLLAIRQREAMSAERVASVVIVAGALVAGLLALLVNQSLDRALADRRRALEEIETAHERLQEQAVELEAQADAAQTAAVEAEQATEHAQVSLLAAEESERRAERLQTATEALGGALSLDDVAKLIIEQASAALGAQSATLASLEGRDTLRFLAVRNASAATVGETANLDEPRPICVAVRTGRPVVLESRDAIRAQFPEIELDLRVDEVHAVAALPIEIDGRILGGLTIRFQRERTLSSVDRSFMAALSRIAGEAFERARLFEAERSARTAAEAANRAKAVFLASMSHELRTPLQAALGFSQLLRSGLYGPVTEQQAEILGRVERSQTHLARVIDDILDFARLEAGRVRMEVEVVPLGEVVAEIAPLVESQADQKRVELSLFPPPNSISVRADRHRLKQILVNLVGNAIKFTGEGGTIRVDASSDDDHAFIRVVDSGVGIPGDRLDAIFEPFVQVDEGHTRLHSGVGLGLAISRDLARAMGGDLTVASTLGAGSTFSVQLPLSSAVVS